MSFIIKYFPVFLFVMSLPSTAVGQQLTSRESLKALQNGVLVVRLDMQKNKMEAYQNTIDSGNLSEKDKNSMKSKLSVLESDRLLYKRNVIKAFSENYLFSKIVFIENQNFKRFINGENIEIEGDNDAIALLKKTEHLFYLIKGNSDSQWLIVNEDFKKPPSPFPSKFSQGPFYKFLMILSPRRSIYYETQLNAAQKVNKKLNQRLMK